MKVAHPCHVQEFITYLLSIYCHIIAKALVMALIDNIMYESCSVLDLNNQHTNIIVSEKLNGCKYMYELPVEGGPVEGGSSYQGSFCVNVLERLN